MPDNVRIELSAQDDASSVVRNLSNELRKFQVQHDSIIRKYGEHAGEVYYQRQTTAIREQIRATTELAAAQERVQRYMQAQSSLSASRVEDLLFPKNAAENIHGYERSFKELVENVDHGSNRMGQGMRHVIALFDEFQRGQRGAMTASATAFLRDTGLLQQGINALMTPWGAVAVAGVAALGAIAYAAEQAHQRIASIRDTAAELALKGLGAGPQVRSDIAKEFDAAKAAGNEYAGTIKDLQVELATKLPAATQETRTEIISLAQSLAGLKNVSAEKAIEPFLKALEHGPEAAAKFVEGQRGLEGVIRSNGMTLSETVRTITNVAQAYRLVVSEFGKGQIMEAGRETNLLKNSFVELSGAFMDGGTGLGGTFNPAMNTTAEMIAKAHDATKDLNESTRQNIGEMMAQADAIKTGNRSLDDRVTALNRIKDAQAGVSRLAGEVGEYGDPTAAQRAANAVKNLEADQRKQTQSGEENEHQLRMNRINAEAQAQHANLAIQTQAAQKRLDEARRMSEIRLPGGDPSQDPSVQQAKAALQEAERKQSDETRRIKIDNAHAVAAEEARGTQARIKAEEDALAEIKAGVAAGRTAKEEIGRQEIKLANLRRELNNKNFQEARDNARAEVELAKGNVDQILAAYARLSQAAVRTGQAPAVNAQIEREKVRDLESAQSQAFTRVTEFNSSMERQDNLRIQANHAALEIQVAQHAMSKDQMAAKEAEFTQTVMAEEERRVEAELKTNGLTEAQKVRLYDHLAELYQKDAEKQLQAQEKLTQAIEAENTKKLKSFQTMFDSVGTAMERLLDAGITRSQTRQQAFQEFGKSIVKSITTELGHLGSQYAGKGLASVLGVKTEGMTDTGIGAVLSRAIGDKLGLTKESTGTEALKGVSDKMQKAVDAQSKASELFKNSVQEFAKASSALVGLADKRGVPGGFSRGASNDNQLGLDSPSSQASAAVSEALTHTGEKLKNYCAILVNQALEKAGVQGSGSGLASSFKNYGSPVSPDDVRKGDVFYAPPSGWGDTGHVGFATGPVSGGRVPVMSSHMQGAASNPAGEETRDISNLTFRRPNYTDTVKVDPSSVAQGVEQGNKEAYSVGQVAIQEGVTQGNSDVVSTNQQLSDKVATLQQTSDQQKQAITQNTQALSQNTQKQGSGTGTASTTSSMTSNLGLLTQGLGIAASAASIFGRQLSPTARAALGAVGVITQLTSFVRTAGSSLGLFGDAAKATSSVTTLLQGANTANTVATTLNTTATTANSTAQSSAAVGSGIGGIFKSIPLIGMLFEQGGIVPSAAGGMISGGGLSILHPKEMVLPAHLSTGLQNMISRQQYTNNNQPGAVLNYNANVTGYHPYASRSAFDALLRQHGNALMGHVENAVRNGWRAA